MIDKDRIPKKLVSLIEDKLQGRTDEIFFPPPVFDAMKGEVIDYKKSRILFSERRKHVIE